MTRAKAKGDGLKSSRYALILIDYTINGLSYIYSSLLLLIATKKYFIRIVLQARLL